MTRLDSEKAVTHGGGGPESVRLDSGLSLPLEEVARGVEAVNDHIRDTIFCCCCCQIGPLYRVFNPLRLFLGFVNIKTKAAFYY